MRPIMSKIDIPDELTCNLCGHDNSVPFAGGDACALACGGTYQHADATRTLDTQPARRGSD